MSEQIPLVPITRPNGKLYRPRKITTEPWENPYDDSEIGALVFGTHDIEAARPLATQVIQWAYDPTFVAGRARLRWLSDKIRNGDPVWVDDAEHGRACVCFDADEPEAADV